MFQPDVLRVTASFERSQQHSFSATEAKIQSRAASFVQGLESIQQWDKQQHPSHPIIQSLNTAAIHEKVVRFFRHQAYHVLNRIQPFFVFISGASGAGKSTVTQKLADHLQDQYQIIKLKLKNSQSSPSSHIPQVVETLNLDNYFPNRSALHTVYPGTKQYIEEVNFTTPEALDRAEIHQNLELLKQGYGILSPAYSFPDSVRQNEAIPKLPAPFVLAEGWLALHPDLIPDQKDFSDLNIFVETSPEILKQRWYKRAHAERGFENDVAGANALFDKLESVYQNYTLPTKQYADMVLNNDNEQPESTSQPDVQRKPASELEQLLQKLSELFIQILYPSPKAAAQVVSEDQLQRYGSQIIKQQSLSHYPQAG